MKIYMLFLYLNFSPQYLNFIYYKENINTIIDTLIKLYGYNDRNIRDDVIIVVKEGTIEYNVFSMYCIKYKSDKNIKYNINEDNIYFIFKKSNISYISYYDPFPLFSDNKIYYFLGEYTFVKYKYYKSLNKECIFSTSILRNNKNKDFIIYYLQIYDILVKNINSIRNYYDNLKYNYISILINKFNYNYTIIIKNIYNDIIFIKSYNRKMDDYYKEIYLNIENIFKDIKNNNENMWRRIYIGKILNYLKEIGLIRINADNKLYTCILHILFPYPITSYMAGISFKEEMLEYEDIVDREVLNKIRMYTDEIYFIKID